MTLIKSVKGKYLKRLFSRETLPKVVQVAKRIA